MYKSPFPAANTFRHGEDVSTDTLHSDSTAWGGFTCMQLFAGGDSYYIRGYECRSQMGSLRESFRMIFDFMGLPTEL